MTHGNRGGAMNTYEYLEYLFPKHKDRPSGRPKTKLHERAKLKDRTMKKTDREILATCKVATDLMYSFSFVRKIGIPGIHRYSTS
jgi:hypothetical protein